MIWPEYQKKINGLENKMSDCYIKSYNLVRAAIFGKKPTFVQWLISQRSTPHVHDEFQFSARYDNVSFSATMMDKAKCVRPKQITYSHPERWDTVIISMTDEEEDLAWAEAKRLEGMPYDLKGQLCHISKWKIWRPSAKKIWCSKTVARLVYAPKPKFKALIAKFGLIDELRPDQLHMLAQYYF